MDGIHDLGGKQGFGAVLRESDEPVFHARWESRVFGLNLVGAGGAARNRASTAIHGDMSAPVGRW